MLPWSSDNNPNGWIEPTTYCQLCCPGCYRGLDLKGHKPLHADLDIMESHIDWLINNRNIHTLSIAGGDPLLYPHLSELVRYASQKKLRTMIYTNGIDLNEEYLIKLKNAGATQIVIHIDVFQGRKNCSTEQEANAIRNEFCNLFRKVGDVNLGFIQPLSRESLKDLEISNRFFINNRDMVNLVVYTLYRKIGWETGKFSGITADLKMSDVVQEQIKTGAFKPASCLKATKNSGEPSWLFSYSVGTSNKILGFFDKKITRSIHTRYFKRKNRYLFISRNNRVHLSGLFGLFFFGSAARIILNPAAWFTKLYFQTFLILRGPIKTGDGWDLCEGCPDAVYDGEKLLPSCILNELEKKKKVS